MEGNRIHPIKPIIMRLIDTLNLMIKFEGLPLLEEMICERNVFSFLWVEITKIIKLITFQNLMITHEWNNLLHGKVEKIILTVFKTNIVTYKENVIRTLINKTFLQKLFEKANILDKITQAMSCLEFTMPK